MTLTDLCEHCNHHTRFLPPPHGTGAPQSKANGTRRGLCSLIQGCFSIVDYRVLETSMDQAIAEAKALGVAFLGTAGIPHQAQFTEADDLPGGSYEMAFGLFDMRDGQKRPVEFALKFRIVADLWKGGVASSGYRRQPHLPYRLPPPRLRRADRRPSRQTSRICTPRGLGNPRNSRLGNLRHPARWLAHPRIEFAFIVGSIRLAAS